MQEAKPSKLHKGKKAVEVWNHFAEKIMADEEIKRPIYASRTAFTPNRDFCRNLALKAIILRI